MVMERLVLQMVSDSESEGNSKIYKRGLVHAALCDGPLKQVFSLQSSISPGPNSSPSFDYTDPPSESHVYDTFSQMVPVNGR